MGNVGSDDPVRTRVAGNVRMYRQTRRLTLEELAERYQAVCGISISSSALLRVEQGKRGVDVTDLVALAQALQVGVPDLLAPGLDEGIGEVPIGPGHQLPRDDYIATISSADRFATTGPAAAMGEAVLVPAEQMQAIAAAFASVGATAAEAARQFSMITQAGTSLHALAVAAGTHARPFGRTSNQLREIGYTTEQLRDRFGPHSTMAASPAEERDRDSCPPPEAFEP